MPDDQQPQDNKKPAHNDTFVEKMSTAVTEFRVEVGSAEHELSDRFRRSRIALATDLTTDLRAAREAIRSGKLPSVETVPMAVPMAVPVPVPMAVAHAIAEFLTGRTATEQIPSTAPGLKTNSDLQHKSNPSERGR